MRTWSVVGVCEVFNWAIEQLTRPPRRDDEPAAQLSDECRAPDPSDCLSCGKRCTWPADAVERPDCSCGLGDGVKLREHWSSCAVWDDGENPLSASMLSDAKLADMEAEMDRQRCTHGRLIRYNGPDEYGLIQARCEDCFAVTSAGRWPDGRDATHPTEPPLTDDELVAVRGLIQERYTDSPAASAAGVSGEAVSPIPPEPASPRSDLSQYNTTHCCRYCGCAGVVAHFDNCTRPNK